MRWWLRADPGIAEWARDLAARESACCAFLTIAVTEDGDRVRWEASAEPAAQAVVDGSTTCRSSRRVPRPIFTGRRGGG